ncbi:MAG: T9SS type A sorting domain-containing protein [Bacteroidetes bacterium]|nr:T9SS type A sorting domain-containing protein [Bacteroidota bacterium]PHX83291.1 MAG: bilirubin oxidase [Flavobacteriales bacterium]
MTILSKIILAAGTILTATAISFAQNALFIPPTLTGTTFNLNIQNGTTQFYTNINTPTYGINGALLAPTLIVNKWDWVTMNVTNNLTGFGNSTTIHWHGLHVPAMDDGGPHQVIAQTTTWSPNFQILNSAGTFWYHPHGDNKTDLHVSKGIAGMIIIKDSIEAGLTLPRTYGTDDFPIIVQTKAFDILNQIAIATELDTAICVNGTVNPFLDAPAQVIRLRLLNGSSSRVYNFGFTANNPFKLIATDAGLLDSAITLTRIRLSPGERAEILLDLQGMIGQTIYLNSFSSEFPNGIYGATTVTGMMGGNIPDYNLNPLNGADFGILQINVVAQTGNPITTMPTTLSTNTPWTNFSVSRNFNLAPDTMMCAQCQVAGPFNINGVHFDMNTINETVYLNTTEKWRVTNNTGIAHPFHIHDMHFYILNIDGGPVPNYEQGKKDVVLVMPMQYVEFITKFEDFADDSIPYMYHCHLLHHEDDGMMGSFKVIDTTATSISEIEKNNFAVFPNPANDFLTITSADNKIFSVTIFNSLGEKIYSAQATTNLNVETVNFSSGLYFVQIITDKKSFTKKIIKK